MDPFEYYTVKENTDHETIFIISQPLLYAKLPDNIRKHANLVYKSKQ